MTDTLQTLAGDNIDLTTVLLIVFSIGWLLERLFKVIKNQKNGGTEYVRTSECKSFKTRIGKESDDHRAHIMEVKDDLSEIKSGIAYLKGKAE